MFGEEKKKEERQKRRRITKMSLFLVGVFLICNITDCMWWLIRQNVENIDPIFTCSTDFAETLNSSVNVIIYSIFGKTFREKLGIQKFATVFCRSTNEQGGKNKQENKKTNTMRSTLYTETAVPTGTQVVTTEV